MMKSITFDDLLVISKKFHHQASFTDFHIGSYWFSDFILSFRLKPFWFWKGGGEMLSIEYIHKRAKVFRIELSLVMIACLAVAILVWQILRILMVLK